MSSLNRQFPPPGSETVSSLFESAVALHGDRIALVEDKTSLSFRELDERTNAIACAAASRMTAPGERACILSKRSLASTAAFLGLCKVGAVSVRLNIGQPVSYLRTIMDDAEPRLIATTREHEALARILCPRGTHIIYLDDCVGLPDGPDWRPQADDRIGIVYTSGTTGRPKGVIQTHRSFLSFVTNYIACTRLESGDKIAMLHDTRSMDMFSALMVGATSYFFPLEHMGFTGLAEWLSCNRITILPTIPSVLRSMLKSFSGHRGEYELRLLRLSGEMLKREDVRNAAAVFPYSCRIMNWFGSTEVAVASGSYAIDELQRMPTIPTGRVFPNVDIKILETGRRTTTGPTGEIVVSSPSLFEGYWRRPELNAEKIFVDPDKPRQRCFRTGDIGYLDSSERLVVLGRVDGQIKVSGYRVEPAEIEAALRSIPGIHDALVHLVLEGSSTTTPVETLAACIIVADPDNPPIVVEIRRQLAEQIPRHMVPAYFSLIDEIPRLAGGKPDRKRLPDVVPLTRRDYNPTTESSTLQNF